MIEVHKLMKSFSVSGGETLIAVNGISFRVSAGEVYGLLGPNGAGKTTTIRMLLGLLKPSRGWAAIGGFRSRETPDEVKRRVGLVAAGAGVYQWLTAREMLLFFADLYAVPLEQARSELDRLSKLLGFRPFLDQYCSTLSTGQKQRINLARALIHQPPVLLLDEPTLGLDVSGSQVVVEFISHLRDEGKAVILCTHRLHEAEHICDRFGLMNRGEIVIEGELDDLREKTGCGSLVEMFLKLSGSGPVLTVSADGGGA